MFGVTDQGFVRKNFEDILKSMETKAKAKFGQEYEIDLYSPEGALLQVVASELAECWEGTGEAYFSAYLDTSTGIQLDYHGKSEEPPITRSQGKYATTTVEFTTNKEMVIPAYTLIRKKDSELNYSTLQTITIGPTMKGTVMARATSVGAEYNTIIGNINKLVNNIDGVVSVTNITPATGGEGIESDFYYRERIRQAKKSRGGSTVNTITAELYKLPIVTNALVLENADEEDAGNGVEPGYIRVYIDGTTSEEVAQVIHTFKAAGIGTEGDQDYVIENASGEEKHIKFYMMTKQQLYVKIVVKQINGELTESIINAVKASIISYVESLQRDMKTVNRKIVTNQIASRAYNASNSLLEVEAFIGTTSNPSSTNNIDIPVGQYFYCDNDTITVEEGV